MSRGQNRKEHNKCRPTFKLIPKLKVSARTKPKFTLEISISVLMPVFDGIREWGTIVVVL